MIDFSDDETNLAPKTPNKRKWAFSITHIMVIGFTTLAFVPMAFLLLLSFPKIQTGFDDTIENELIETSLISKNSITKWFNELVSSVIHESNTATSKEFLEILNSAKVNSEMELKEFTESEIWEIYTNSYKDYYTHFSSMHADFYDIFLINAQGDILFTLAKESDLGTNLNTGPYKDTLFAQTFRNSLNSTSTQFSDLEYYEPSSDTISGFIITPIINDRYKKIGAFALQVNFETAINLLNDSRHATLNNYIVNDELLLRNKLDNIEHQDTLSTSISNSLTNKWDATQTGSFSTFNLNENYQGIDSNEVIGIYHTLNLINKKWALVFEIDVNEVYAPVIELKNTYFYILCFSSIFTLFFSYFLAKRIAKPIKSLSNLTKVISTGEDISITNHKGFRETCELADNFNQMIMQKHIYETAIEENRKIAVNSLKELENIRFAMDQHSIITVTDIKGNILLSNQKFTDISGYSEEELLGNNHRMVNSGFHNKEFWRNMYLTISSGNIWRGEIQNKSKNNNFYWVQSTIIPIIDSLEKVDRYIAIRTDITDRKNAELALLESKELAESAVVAKSEFLASMSHEIRTPMNGILGMLNILQKTKLDVDQSHKVGLAKNSAKSLLTIINDILDFSKIEAGKLEIENIEFNLIDLIGEVSESLSLNTQDKDIEIILDYSSISQELFISDPSRIKQIIFNIAGNAVKFTTQGCVTLEIKTQKQDAQFLFSCKITDTGIGISEDKLPLLFEKFTQADNSTTREYGGTGLGLAIVKQLVELMDGEIYATSKLGEGSCFTFNILLDGNVCEDAFSQYINKANNVSSAIIDTHDKTRTNLKTQFEHLGIKTQDYRFLDDFHESTTISNYQIIAVDEDQIINLQHYENFLNDCELNDCKLVVMTKIKNKTSTHSHYKYSFPKPTIFQDIIYCLDLLDKNHAKEDISPTVNEAQQSESLSEQKQFKVLLVEDNFVNQQVALSLLEELNCVIDIAENGEEAIAALNKKPKFYEVILMDCQMPIMDGYTASHQIRLGKAGSHYSKAPIIALTANAMKGDKEKCLAAGMDDYLTKPIDQSDLENKLNKYLN